MHVFISKKPLSPVRWQQAFPGAVIVRHPDEVKRIFKGEGTIWLDFTCLDPAERVIWLDKARQLQAPVVVLSNMPNDNEAMLVFRSGGDGYCHVLAASQQLKKIALVVDHGGYWVGSSFIEKVLSISARHMAAFGGYDHASFYRTLTEREQMVAQLVAKGASNKEIASSLDITERTVKAHMSSIFAKSGARDRIHLVLMLTENKTIPA